MSVLFFAIFALLMRTARAEEDVEDLAISTYAETTNEEGDAKGLVAYFPCKAGFCELIAAGTCCPRDSFGFSCCPVTNAVCCNSGTCCKQGRVCCNNQCCNSTSQICAGSSRCRSLRCIQDVARAIMSEASVGTQDEKIAIGFACQRNRAHAKGQTPTPAIESLAKSIVSMSIPDPTQGADYWYSPRSMPNQNQCNLCKFSSVCPCGKGIMDCGGGLEQVPGLPYKTYKPAWANEMKRVVVKGVRDRFFKFFAMGGAMPLLNC